jgi:hypothetical protein
LDNLVLNFRPRDKNPCERIFEEGVVKFTSDGSMIVSVLYPEDGVDLFNNSKIGRVC